MHLNHLALIPRQVQQEMLMLCEIGALLTLKHKYILQLNI